MRTTLAAFSALLIVSAMAVPVFAESGSGAAEETDRVIVTMADDASELEDLEAVASVEAETGQMVAVEVPANESVEDFIEDLEKRSDVERAEPDHLIRLTYTPNDPDVAVNQYHHLNIETKKAWDKTKGASDVVVAIIDDGIDLQHPDLKKQILFPFDAVKETGARLPAGEHGTHVAGLIGSSIDNSIGGAGVAPNTKIMPINVFEGDLAYTSDIIQAIHYAVDKGADIINLSLGTYDHNAAFNEAIQFAHKKGLVIVAAAGNEGVSNAYYPASFPNVISVGATTAKEVRAPFSNYGGHIDIAAPGSFIYSTLPHDSYGTMSGTSMASPIVAGVAALVKAAEPSLSNLEIENRLYTTADDLGAAGKDVYYGNGRVNARKALKIEFFPAPYVLPVYDYSTSVSGTTEAGAAVAITAGGKPLASGKATPQGKFTIAIPKQPAGVKLSVTSTQASGAVSFAAELVVKDGTKPAAPAINAVADNAVNISGKAEVNAKVFAYVGNKKLGEATAANGAFTIKIAKQKAGTAISVYAVDAAGNRSASTTVKVIDKTPPPLPEVNVVGDNAASITGKVETNARVAAFINKQQLGEAIAKNGAFSIAIPKQKAGTAIVLYATDAAGNKSAGKTIKVADKTAPPAPTVNGVTDKTTAVAGKAEANAKVYIYNGTKKLGEAAVAKGVFSIKIAKQKAGASLTIYAVDAAGNKSAGRTLKVADKTAPAAPSINALSTISTRITGKAESNSRVYAYSGNKKLGEAAAKNGAYSIVIAKQKAGTAIAVYAMDAAKNKSSTKTAKVTAPSKVAGKYQTTANLHLRTGASVRYKSIAVIPKGKTVAYVVKSGGWYKVKYGSKTGWVSSYYLRKPAAAAPQPPASSGTATNTLPLDRKTIKQSYVLKRTALSFSGSEWMYSGTFKIEFLLSRSKAKKAVAFDRV